MKHRSEQQVEREENRGDDDASADAGGPLRRGEVEIQLVGLAEPVGDRFQFAETDIDAARLRALVRPDDAEPFEMLHDAHSPRRLVRAASDTCSPAGSAGLERSCGLLKNKIIMLVGGQMS